MYVYMYICNIFQLMVVTYEMVTNRYEINYMATHTDETVGVYGVSANRDETVGIYGVSANRDETVGVYGVSANRDERVGIYGVSANRDETVGVYEVSANRDGRVMKEFLTTCCQLMHLHLVVGRNTEHGEVVVAGDCATRGTRWGKVKSRHKDAVYLLHLVDFLLQQRKSITHLNVVLCLQHSQ